MSGGDLLFIFSFLILPTVILVSCIWLYILLRKGILLPPARHAWVESDADVGDVAAHDGIQIDDELVVARAPSNVMHVADADDAPSIDAADASQHTLEFDASTVDNIVDDIDAPDNDMQSEAIAVDDMTHAVTEGDTGTEALPVQTPLTHVQPVEADDAVIDERLPVAVAPNPADATDHVVADVAESADAPPTLPTTAELVPSPTLASDTSFDDEVFAPLEPTLDTATVEDIPDIDAEVFAAEENMIEITDEHPIVELAPAAISVNGVAEEQSPTNAVVPRRQVRRPAERVRPALFRKGRGNDPSPS